jgi:hypothetical protein
MKFIVLQDCQIVGNFLRALATSYILVTCIIPQVNGRRHSKNAKDWIIRSQVSYIIKNNLKIFYLINLMNCMGEIYCITSPSNKKYIGQCVKKLSNGKIWGYISRWKEHIRDSKTRNYCRLLNSAIKKYEPENFHLEVLKECDIEELDYYEKYYIENFNTLTPNGYNLTTGGSVSRHSDETNKLKSMSMIGKNLGKIYPKRTRKRDIDNQLPKYIRYYKDSNGKEGYRISNHPNLNDKSFLSKYTSLEEKLQQALNYINEISTDIR